MFSLTLAFVVGAAFVIIQHFNSREVICAHYRRLCWTLRIIIGHLAIVTCSCPTVAFLPNFTILRGESYIGNNYMTYLNVRKVTEF